MDRKVKEILKSLVPQSSIDAYHSIRLKRIAKKRKSFSKKYQGDRFECNFCGKSHNRFIPDGERFEVLYRFNVASAGYRANCLCPNCGSKDRERLLFEFLKRQTTVFSQETKVLHIAPESNLRQVLTDKLGSNYINGDLDPKLADCRVDITQIPFEAETFDMVICNHVLEHVPDDRLAMREIKRVLKPGGFAILQVPLGLALTHTIEDPSVTDKKEREKRFGQFDHIRIYGHDYYDRLTKSGFDVKRIPFTDYLSESEADKLSVLKNEEIIQCFA